MELTALPMLPVSSIGSLPKPAGLAQAEMAPLDRQDEPAMLKAQQEAVRDWLNEQAGLGVDLPVDGEQYRRSMISYFLEGWGCAEIDPDPVWVLDNLYSQRAVIVRSAARPRNLLVKWFALAAEVAGPAIKMTITGPYTLRDWCFDSFYSSRRDAVLAIAGYVREEVEGLAAAGARYIQIDEPAFVTRHDQPEELDLAIEAMRKVTATLPPSVVVFTHMCYGAFHEVYPKMLELPAQVFCLELSHVSRELLDILRRHPLPPDRGLGFGVVDAQEPRIEPVEEIEARIRQALNYVPPSQLWINPDCGLQALPRESAIGKLRNLVEATRRVRKSLS